MKRIWLPLLLLSLPVLSSTHAQQPPPAEKDKWDIAADLGPTTKLSFETSEGTWMNVDVSPDGRRIVFDLLGDLYTMPIGGSGASPAERITSGPAFDMQPRFSPDGTRIAFSSDRDGLWNIWTVGADGKDARQVSKEKRWFETAKKNSPAPPAPIVSARSVKIGPKLCSTYGSPVRFVSLVFCPDAGEGRGKFESWAATDAFNEIQRGVMALRSVEVTPGPSWSAPCKA